MAAPGPRFFSRTWLHTVCRRSWCYHSRSMIQAIGATSRWGLSGTPPVSGTGAGNRQGLDDGQVATRKLTKHRPAFLVARFARLLQSERRAGRVDDVRAGR